MSNKTIGAILVCFVGLLCRTGTAQALTVSVSAVSANPGQTGVEVVVAVDNAKGIAGGDLLLTYDATVLTARQARGADLLTSAGIMAVANLDQPGQVKVAMAGAAGITSGSGALVTVAFDVKAGAAPGAYALDLQASLSDENGAALPATTKNGALTVKGAAPAAAALILSATSLAFSDTKIGATSRKTLTLTNTGAASLNVTNITVTGAGASQYGVTPKQFAVPAKGSKAVTVSFAPTTAGAKSASLSIAHSAAGSPASVTLSGKGVAASALTLSVASLTFDDTKVGSTSRKTVTLTNTGAAALNVTNITVAGTGASQFGVTPKQFALPAKGTKTVTVTFTPTMAGAKSASLSVAHNGTGSPATVALSGKGVAAAAPTLSASSLTFDDTKVGATTSKSVTLTNPGTASLNVSGVTLTGIDASQFTVSPTRVTLAAKGKQNLTVTFAPTAAGAKSAALSIAYDGSGSPVPVSLSGKGTEPQPEGLQVSVGTGAGSPGSSVTVPIAVNTAKGIAGGDLTLSYNAQALTAREVKAANLLTSAGIALIPNLGTAGQVKVAMAGAAGIASGSGALLQVTFEVLASATPGTYDLGLEAMLWDENGMALPATVVKGAIAVKARSGKPATQVVPVFTLSSSYPNPFNSTTLVPYQAGGQAHIRLAIHDLLGQEVRLLVDQVQGAGTYQVVWDGKDEQGQPVSSGVYLYRLVSQERVETRRMLLLK